MISPVSSSGISSPPSQSSSGSKKRNLSESDEQGSISSSTSFDRLLSGSNASNGLPQFLRKKVPFREATHSESLKGLVNAKAVGSNSSSAAPAYVSYTAKKSEKSSSSIPPDQVNSSLKNVSLTRDLKYGFKNAEIDLFPREKLQSFLKWSRVRSIGPGLNNLGNTCFLNSVMQCLFYTIPLAEFSLAREHSKRCKISKNEFCGFCTLEKLMFKVHRQNESVISPMELINRNKLILKHFRPGRQEDSHEFLRLFIDCLQKASLGMNPDALKSLDARSKETTAIHRIFGGYLQSTVTCASCNHVSRTFDQFLDISLDVNKLDNLSSALKVFTTPELLSKGNRYKCEACHRLVEAHKRFSIYKTPEILTIQLKRFSVNPFTGQTNKLNGSVNFPEKLNISELISDKNSGEACQYRLYGVIVHEGHSCNSGHYHAFVRNSNDIWYSMNDSSVHQVSLDTVLRQRAYILFYQKQHHGVTSSTPLKDEKLSSDDVKVKINIDKPPEKQKRTMEEKMTAVREASKAYTSQQQQQQKSKNRQIESSTDTSDVEIEDETIPELVVATQNSELRASSMWHMAALSESFNNHPPVASKRIKYNFQTQWKVSKI